LGLVEAEEVQGLKSLLEGHEACLRRLSEKVNYRE
jgi:hypothetical protein